MTVKVSRSKKVWQWLLSEEIRSFSNCCLEPKWQTSCPNLSFTARYVYFVNLVVGDHFFCNFPEGTTAGVLGVLLRTAKKDNFLKNVYMHFWNWEFLGIFGPWKKANHLLWNFRQQKIRITMLKWIVKYYPQKTWWKRDKRMEEWYGDDTAHRRRAFNHSEPWRIWNK